MYINIIGAIINVPSIAFNEIKYAAIKTKSDVSNANENEIGIKNLISPGINNDPIKTVAPNNNAPIPVPLLNKSPIFPIRFEKKVDAVAFSKSNNEFNNIEPIEQPESTLHTCPVAMKNKSMNIKIVTNVISFPIFIPVSL